MRLTQSTIIQTTWPSRHPWWPWWWHLRQIVSSDRRATLLQITTKLNIEHARHISQRTIDKNVGYGRKHHTMPLLNHYTQWLAFVASHQWLTLEQSWTWYGCTNHYFICTLLCCTWRRSLESNNSNYQVGVVHHDGMFVIFWSAFSWYGMGPPVVPEESWK